METVIEVVVTGYHVVFHRISNGIDWFVREPVDSGTFAAISRYLRQEGLLDCVGKDVTAEAIRDLVRQMREQNVMLHEIDELHLEFPQDEQEF